MEEFKASNPKADIHPSWLGALSIGRRYISPLSELIKIPPQNLGFGQYQHDAKDGTLKVAMERVVTDAVAERGGERAAAADERSELHESFCCCRRWESISS